MADARPSTAVDPVEALNLAGSSATSAAAAGPVHDLSMWSLFIQADWVVKLVILMLILASFWSWAIIFEKWMLMKQVRMKAKNFEHDFWAAEALDKFHDKVKKRANHPMAIIFTAAMEEWFRSKNTTSGSGSFSSPNAKQLARERIVSVMQVSRNREVEKLENGLTFLAITSSSAPFIGLFGTVWGIMNSFHSIALSKNTSLAAVAPGIAEALFATAIGLLAAIPAYIFYNRYTREISQFAGRLEDFSIEFNTILSRQMEG